MTFICLHNQMEEIPQKTSTVFALTKLSGKLAAAKKRVKQKKLFANNLNNFSQNSVKNKPVVNNCTQTKSCEKIDACVNAVPTSKTTSCGESIQTSDGSTETINQLLVDSSTETRIETTNVGSQTNDPPVCRDVGCYVHTKIHTADSGEQTDLFEICNKNIQVDLKPIETCAAFMIRFICGTGSIPATILIATKNLVLEFEDADLKRLPYENILRVENTRGKCLELAFKPFTLATPVHTLMFGSVGRKKEFLVTLSTYMSLA